MHEQQFGVEGRPPPHSDLTFDPSSCHRFPQTHWRGRGYLRCGELSISQAEMGAIPLTHSMPPRQLPRGGSFLRIRTRYPKRGVPRRKDDRSPIYGAEHRGQASCTSAGASAVTITMPLPEPWLTLATNFSRSATQSMSPADSATGSSPPRWPRPIVSSTTSRAATLSTVLVCSYLRSRTRFTSSRSLKVVEYRVRSSIHHHTIRREPRNLEGLSRLRANGRPCSLRVSRVLSITRHVCPPPGDYP